MFAFSMPPPQALGQEWLHFPPPPPPIPLLLGGCNPISSFPNPISVFPKVSLR